MKIEKNILLWIVVALCSLPSAASDRDRFAGTWKLVSIADTRPARETQWAKFGARPQGYIMYDRTGHMCVQIMDPDRRKWKTIDPAYVPSSDELNATVAGYAAYCGRYDVNEKEKFVVHHVELELVPNSVGEDRKRQYRFHGDRLDLTPAPGLTLTWEKLK